MDGFILDPESQARIERALFEIDTRRGADTSSAAKIKDGNVSRAKRSEASVSHIGVDTGERVEAKATRQRLARLPQTTGETAPERCTPQSEDAPSTRTDAPASRTSADYDISPDIVPNIEFRAAWFTETHDLLSAGWKIATTPSSRGIAGWLEQAAERLRPLVYRPIQNDVRPDASKDKAVDALDDAAAREDTPRHGAPDTRQTISCVDGGYIHISEAAGPDPGTMRFEWSMTHLNGRDSTFIFDAPADLCTELWCGRVYNALAASPEFRARLSRTESVDASLRIPSAPNRELPNALTRVVEKGSKATFDDLHKLRSGRDCFSSMKLPDLEKAVGRDTARAVRDHCRQFDAGERASLNERILRWHLRGLPIDMAARKIDVDLEARANAQNASGPPF